MTRMESKNAEMAGEGSGDEADALIRALSLKTGATAAYAGLEEAVMRSDGELSGADRAMVATVISAHNRCAYGQEKHARRLGAHWPAEKVAALVDDWTSVDLDDRQWAMLSYAVSLTGAPDEVDAEMIEELREAGLSEAGVVELALVTSYANLTDRLALGLRVQKR